MSFKKNNASENRGYNKPEGGKSSSRGTGENRSSSSNSSEGRFSPKSRDTREGNERPSFERSKSSDSKFTRPASARPSASGDAPRPNRSSDSNPRGERFTPNSRENREGSERPAFDRSKSADSRSSRPTSRPSAPGDSSRPNRPSSSNPREERFAPRGGRDNREDRDHSSNERANPSEHKHYRPSSRPSASGDATRANHVPRSNPSDDRFSHTNRESREERDNASIPSGIPRSPRSLPNGAATNAEADPNSMRLNRFISNAGICSRREADILIQKGLITVNGVVTTEMGTIVKKTDKVIYDSVELNSEKKIYVLLNKPKDVVTTREDEHAKMTVLDLVRNACTERIYPVGRLDKNTTGVLLLTNDGELTKLLTHPKYERKKIYHVFLDKAVTKADMEAIALGVKLEDGKIVPDSIEYVDGDKHQIGIEIHSGKNRIVRRIFEHFGYRIEKLDRVYFAGLTKKGLQRSHWRHLTEQEVKLLKAGLLT